MAVNKKMKYEGGTAHFKIEKERPGIYVVSLEAFVGDHSRLPPSKIIMTRGIRRWTGSINDTVLLDNLGMAIEEEFHGVPARKKPV